MRLRRSCARGSRLSRWGTAARRRSAAGRERPVFGSAVCARRHCRDRSRCALRTGFRSADSPASKKVRRFASRPSSRPASGLRTLSGVLCTGGWPARTVSTAARPRPPERSRPATRLPAASSSEATSNISITRRSFGVDQLADVGDELVERLHALIAVLAIAHRDGAVLALRGRRRRACTGPSAAALRGS